MDQLKTPAPQESKLHFLDYWRIIRIRKTVILAVFLLVVITATVVTYILPELFSSTVRLKVERDTTDVPGMVGSAAAIQRGTYDPYFIQTEYEVLQSEVILGPVIKELNLNQKWGDKYYGGTPLKTYETMENLKKAMKVTAYRNASIIEVKVFSDSPEEARDIANKVAEVYRAHRMQMNDQLMRPGIAVLENERKEHEEKVREQQAEVDRLRIALGVNDPDPMSTGPTPTLSTESLRTLTAQLLGLKGLQVHQETQVANLLEKDRQDLRYVIQTALDQPDMALNTLLNELDLAEQEVLQLRRDLTEENEILIASKRKVDQLNEKINRKIDGIIEGLQTRVNATRAQVKEIETSLDTAKATDREVAEKSRPYYVAKQKLAELQHYNTALGLKILAMKTELNLPRQGVVTLLDEAYADPEPVRPRKKLNIALGVIIGLVVGIGLAFFIEYLDTSVKTIDDVERTLQAPVLGVIPQNVGFLLEEGAESPHAEAYRVLRTNLLFSRKDDKLNSVAVVSAGAGEGKSTTVLNLATVFAQNGSRVVIVDSDLRRPTLHKILRVTNNIGLTNYLLRQNSLEEVIQTTSLPTLDFMASGKLPSSSMGVLSSAQMKGLINELKQRYDYVFFDSPPIMGVSDASILASEVDLTLQVIQYRRYPQPMNIRAKQMIEKVGGNLMGIVLNNINMSQDESYYYYSGYYHEYYSKNDDDAPMQTADAGDKGRVDIKPKY